MLKDLSQTLIGCRVKAAREAGELTQDQLAQQLGLNDRQSVSDLENGKRALKPTELLTLAELFNRDIEYFLDPLAVTGEAHFSWRAAHEVSPASLNGFEQEAGQLIGLLRWLRAQQKSPTSALKPTLRLSAHSSYELAQDSAESLVDELELGVIPAINLIDHIERKLDIPVLFIDINVSDMDGDVSGATCHLDQMSAILINRQESDARRVFDLAHELFHALTWDAMKPAHRESNSIEPRGKRKRTEQLADNFAAALLMPKKSLDKLLNRDRLKDSDYLRDVAGQLQVAPMTLAWRLFNLKMIDEATRTTLSQHKQPSNQLTLPKPYSPTFVHMLHEALVNGRISARKASKVMRKGLDQMLKLFAEYDLPAPFDL